MYRPIPHELFDFLSGLKSNNDRQWFLEHKRDFIEHVQLPMIRFIEEMAGWLQENSPAYVADPRPNGGSLFRIHRDVRFSKDKSPYKTNVGCHFRHRAGRDAHAPGFYVHLSPEEIFFGGGIWMPPPPALGLIRDAIANDPDRWGAIIGDPAFIARTGGLGPAEALRRPPAGHASDERFIEHIKLKSFYSFSSASRDDVCSPAFPAMVQETFRSILPLMKFLTDVLGQEWD